jgi:DNA-binding transcriptional LysR family regulator
MKPRTTLEQWYALQAVIDHGGFARAAEALNRSQSSVSYLVNRLQQQLDLPLLEIEGRRARLTESGKVLLRQARRLLDDAQLLEDTARQLGSGQEAEIRLIVDAAFPTPWLMAALEAFAGQNPATRVQLDQVILSGAEDALLGGKADLAISPRVPERFLGDRLTTIEFCAVAHPDHPLQHTDTSLSDTELAREMQVVVRDSSQQHPRDHGWLGAEHRWTVSSFETAITTISQGLGFGWLPQHKIVGELNNGTLKPLNLRHGASYFVDLYLVLGNPGNAGPATHSLASLLTHQAINEKLK